MTVSCIFFKFCLTSRKDIFLLTLRFRIDLLPRIMSNGSIFESGQQQNIWFKESASQQLHEDTYDITWNQPEMQQSHHSYTLNEQDVSLRSSGRNDSPPFARSLDSQQKQQRRADKRSQGIHVAVDTMRAGRQCNRLLMHPNTQPAMMQQQKATAHYQNELTRMGSIVTNTLQNFTNGNRYDSKWC